MRTEATMADAEYYRGQEQFCGHMAETVPSQEDKDRWRKLAQQWRALAEQAERASRT
jgi:hypothetical protein